MEKRKEKEKFICHFPPSQLFSLLLKFYLPGSFAGPNRPLLTNTGHGIVEGLMTIALTITATQKTVVAPLGSCVMLAVGLPRTSPLYPLGTAKDVGKVTPSRRGCSLAWPSMLLPLACLWWI